MKASLKKAILSSTNSSDAKLVEVIQELWSGYGFIARVQLIDSEIPFVIVKNIEFPETGNHPRGWNTSASHARKVKSYEVEIEWYKTYSTRCTETCRIPKYLGSKLDQDDTLVILEDLDSVGYPIRKSQLNKEEVKVCLSWLASFHATFLGQVPDGLWAIGSYWHLGTRKEEFDSMTDGIIKQSASKMDNILNSCKYQTIIHGDAKVANFCFSENGNKVAALDFQYVGCGCGMKDVAYFLGSCLTESQCDRWEVELLNSYFTLLKLALHNQETRIDFDLLENEWRSLFPVAWSDFTRFLLGWMPSHQKINGYSEAMMSRSLAFLK